MTLMAAAPLALKSEQKTNTLEAIIGSLRSKGAYSVEAQLSVAMPQLAEDIIYGVTLHQLPTVESDTLAPAPYIVDWRREKNDNDINGFSAYYPGNHFRMQGDRLLEYHYSADTHPFGKAKGNGGVQNTAQFVNYLPVYLANDLERMSADNRYHIHMANDTLVNGKKSKVIKVVMDINGETAMEGEYVFSSPQIDPVRVTLENNPGSISEQTITVTYNPDAPLATPAPPATLDEDVLIARYPNEFATKRQSSYRLDNLAGRKLPAFESPTLSGDRYTHAQGEKFRQPVLLVFAEAEGVFTDDLVSGVREGVSQLPYPVEIVWAFADKHTDAISETVGETGVDETVLVGVKGLARDCGITELPVIVVVGTDGIVKSTSAGYNNHIASDVINMFSNLN